MNIPEPHEVYEQHTRAQDEAQERFIAESTCETCYFFNSCFDSEYDKKACDDYEEVE